MQAMRQRKKFGHFQEGLLLYLLSINVSQQLKTTFTTLFREEAKIRNCTTVIREASACQEEGGCR